MVQIGALPRNALNCPEADRTWVTLDCDGRFGHRIAAMNSISLAKMAMLTNKAIRITVDDSRRNGSYCYGSQVILFR